MWYASKQLLAKKKVSIENLYTISSSSETTLSYLANDIYLHAVRRPLSRQTQPQNKTPPQFIPNTRWTGVHCSRAHEALSLPILPRWRLIWAEIMPLQSLLLAQNPLAQSLDCTQSPSPLYLLCLFSAFPFRENKGKETGWERDQKGKEKKVRKS